MTRFAEYIGYRAVVSARKWKPTRSGYDLQVDIPINGPYKPDTYRY